jgi:Domain of unknown function (DUF1707)
MSASEPSGMRASDADRDRVLDVLREAAAEGRLTPDELDERMGAALTARTLGELATLTADLPAGLPEPDWLAAGPGPPEPAPDVFRIDQRGGSVQRTGRWILPERLELRPAWCDVTLDLTEAIITRPLLRIDLNMRGGSLLLLTGPGMVVTANALVTRYTDLEIGPDPEPGERPALVVELAGKMRYGWIGARRATSGF